MPQFGYSLMCELHHPNQLVKDARRAEEAGFDFVTISDHIHPWLYSHDHSAYAWTVLGALAATTERVRLVSLVTCPTIRYHPVIVAQKAATVAAMSEGRFELGVGAGENLNEHVVGQGWPPADVRHEMLTEALEIIELLWEGGMESYRGAYYTVQDARIYTLPDVPPPIHVAVSGPSSIRLAADHGQGMVATEPKPELVQQFEEAAGADRPKIGQLGVSVGPDEADALRLAHERFRFAAPGWKVMAELPNPVNFEAATASVREEDMAERIPCGPDPEKHLVAIQRWLDAGFDQIALVQVGADQEAFFEMWESELSPRLRSGGDRRP